ncbi:hypothetical protein M569_07458 [Genlisea aurea]|uniref:Uncharacterized protein n=1 Tax=Genlisea aurea TaxID=192259 RepID=S8E4R3_9LAMI|nr:hypothetical protein M569_07458 [Genlisea aurea]
MMIHTYIRLQHLVESLQYAAREDAYYGHKVKTSDQEFMTGTFYLVSWDVAEWISTTDIDEKYHPIHLEDVVFSHWLHDGNLGKNQYDMKGKIYDIPRPGHHFPHEFWSGTIGVHKLKTREKWIQTLDYFNVTKDLKPSKFYHYP